jgi:hypothetical protein
VLALWREAMKETTHDRGNQHTGGKGSNPTVARSDRGRAYTLARLKQHAPALFERVRAAELSAYAATVMMSMTVAA